MSFPQTPSHVESLILGSPPVKSLKSFCILIGQVRPLGASGQFLGTVKLAYDRKSTVLSAWGTPSFDVCTWWG